MKRIEISILAALIFSVALSMCTLHTECSEIRENVLRLHVLANSDSEEDQSLKLQVRDRLLEISGEIYSNAGSKDEAIRATEENLSVLHTEAEKVVRAKGYDYPVKVSLEECYFNTRTYGNITLPAGTYQALRIVIGEGAGHNWWCVMFPPLCVSPASDGEALLEDVLSSEEMDLVEGGGYEMRFKCVELYEDFRRRMSEKSGK
jgi:stage II sporulation protein R